MLEDLVIQTPLSMFEEHEIVRVKTVPTDKRHIDGTEGIVRPPVAGDIGAIVHCLGPSDDGLHGYIVECVGDGGVTIWLMDFREDELERI